MKQHQRIRNLSVQELDMLFVRETKVNEPYADWNGDWCERR